jgi:hypothetical protein
MSDGSIEIIIQVGVIKFSSGSFACVSFVNGCYCSAKPKAIHRTLSTSSPQTYPFGHLNRLSSKQCEANCHARSGDWIRTLWNDAAGC